MSNLGVFRCVAARILKSAVHLTVLASIVACASSGPATKFYSLFPESGAATVNFDRNDITIGVGPVILPEYLDNPAVVSLTKSQLVRVSGYHAWAGDLKDAIMRVLADDISQLLSVDGVMRFPWDNRVRPDFQIRMVFDEFGGVRGGEARLSATWTLLNKNGSEILRLDKEELSISISSEGVDAYVAALNGMLNRLSTRIARKIVETVSLARD